MGGAGGRGGGAVCGWVACGGGGGGGAGGVGGPGVEGTRGGGPEANWMVSCVRRFLRARGGGGVAARRLLSDTGLTNAY